MQVQTGDVIFFRYRLNPISALIRFFINLGKSDNKKCPYNHVGFVCEVDGVKMLVESNGKGTVATSFERRIRNETIAILRPTVFFNREVFIGNALSHTGKPYDFKGTLWDQLRFQLTGKWKGYSGNKATDKFYCSEYYAYIMHLATSKIYFRDWHKTDPQDIYINGIFDKVYSEL